MERDAVIAHGALQFLKESTAERSDKYEMYVSENSGQIAVANPQKTVTFVLMLMDLWNSIVTLLN